MEMILWSVIAFIWLASGIKMCLGLYKFNSIKNNKKEGGFTNMEIIPLYIIFLLLGWVGMFLSIRH